MLPCLRTSPIGTRSLTGSGRRDASWLRLSFYRCDRDDWWSSTDLRTVMPYFISNLLSPRIVVYEESSVSLSPCPWNQTHVTRSWSYFNVIYWLHYVECLSNIYDVWVFLSVFRMYICTDFGAKQIPSTFFERYWYNWN